MPAVKKLLTVVKAVPQMEHFIKEISNLVQSDLGPSKGLDGVLPALKKWANEREDCAGLLRLRKMICVALYGEDVEVSDHQIVTSVFD